MGNFGKFWAVSVLEESKSNSLVACGGKEKPSAEKSAEGYDRGKMCVKIRIP